MPWLSENWRLLNLVSKCTDAVREIEYWFSQINRLLNALAASLVVSVVTWICFSPGSLPTSWAAVTPTNWAAAVIGMLAAAFVIWNLLGRRTLVSILDKCSGNRRRSARRPSAPLFSALLEPPDTKATRRKRCGMPRSHRANRKTNSSIDQDGLSMDKVATEPNRYPGDLRSCGSRELGPIGLTMQAHIFLRRPVILAERAGLIARKGPPRLSRWLRAGR
jgi:hypothetical protein